MANGTIKLEIDEASYQESKEKILELYRIANEIDKKMSFSTKHFFDPNGVFISTETDGSQWVMLEDFITAQKIIQRTVYGTGWVARLSNFIIGLGWLIGGIATSKGQKGNIP